MAPIGRRLGKPLPERQIEALHGFAQPLLALRPRSQPSRAVKSAITLVIVRDGQVAYFLAGDATYSQANLRAERTDGVTNDPATALATLRAIKAFAAQQPTIILPAHDPESARRLAEREVFA